jgi:hypothetical protein
VQKSFIQPCFLVILLVIIKSFSSFAQTDSVINATSDTPFIDSSKIEAAINKPAINPEDTIISQKDTTLIISDSGKVAKKPFERQLRLMVDISHPIGSLFLKDQYSFETYWDYTLKEDVFAVLELGYGGGKIDYENLKYSSANSFIKLGIERSLFSPIYDQDRDMLVIGARYAAAYGTRSDAVFTIPNPFGGTKESTVDAKSFFAHWAEITMGLRFELLPRLYTGWNIRLKINFSPNAFDGQVAPNNLAGFGKTGGATAIGFNYYLGYSLRWQQRK